MKWSNSREPAEEEIGHNLPLSVPRRIMGDLMSFAKAIPSVPVQRPMNVAPVMSARARLGRNAPGWCAIFTKAFGLMAREFPELRRAYIPFPRAHLYEHPCSIASIAIEREYQGEPGVFWAHLAAPKPSRSAPSRATCENGRSSRSILSAFSAGRS